MAESNKDLVPTVAVAVGAAALIGGAYYFAKKPGGVDPGDSFKVKFSFTYLGVGGDYVLQVSLGRIWPFIFDHVEGLTWEKQVTLIPGKAEFEMECELPQGTDPKTYDGEALIRTPEMGRFDSLVKVTTQGAIVVRKA